MIGSRIELCGALRVEIDGRRLEDSLVGRQLRLLFARLALADGAAVSRDELMAVLLPAGRPRDAPAILRTLLSRLRCALGSAGVEGRGAVRLILPEPVVIDVKAAEEALAQARAALDEQDFLTGFGRAQAALEILRAELLPDETGEWLEQHRRSLDQLRLEALECEALAGARLSGAQRARAVRAGQELVKRAPLRESGHAALMQAHAACGNVAEATQVYVGLRDRLREELGTTPDATIVGLYERLLAGGDERVAKPVVYEGSPRLLSRALQALERAESGDAELRSELLLELGASLERAGADEQARQTFAEAAGVARELKRGDLLAAAALGYGGRGIPFAPGTVDEALVELLEEALAALGNANTPLGARLLGRLATALSSSSTVETRAELAEKAVELARKLGDPGCLTFALSARHLAAWGPDNLPQRRADAAEVLALASAHGDPDAALAGHLWTFTDSLEASELEQADRALDAYRRLADELGHPGYLWWEGMLRAMRHFMAGRFADAELCAERVLRLAPRSQDAVVGQLVTAQICALRKEAGKLPQLEAVVQNTIARHPDIPAWSCFLAYLYAEAGRLDQARPQFDRLLTELDTLPRDHLWLISMALLADTCAALNDAAAAAVLHQRLARYQGKTVVGLGGLWFGPVDHHLALLARTTRDYAAAERYFEAAVAADQSMAARPWLGHTLREMAAMYATRKATGDHQRAQALLDQATTIADELQMLDLQNAIDRVHAMLTG